VPTLTMFGRFSVATRCGAAIPGFSTALVTCLSMAVFWQIVDSPRVKAQSGLENSRSNLGQSCQYPPFGGWLELLGTDIRRAISWQVSVWDAVFSRRITGAFCSQDSASKPTSPPPFRPCPNFTQRPATQLHPREGTGVDRGSDPGHPLTGNANLRRMI